MESPRTGRKFKSYNPYQALLMSQQQMAAKLNMMSQMTNNHLQRMYANSFGTPYNQFSPYALTGSVAGRYALGGRYALAMSGGMGSRFHVEDEQMEQLRFQHAQLNKLWRAHQEVNRMSATREARGRMFTFLSWYFSYQADFDECKSSCENRRE